MNLNGCAVANKRRQFGATNSSDVQLRIIGSNREEYEGNPLHLHSEVLQKSEFFKTLLSERWSSDIRPFEIEVITSQSFEQYIKCIEMMYSSSVRFSNVDECLGILPVASELLVDKLMQQCMGYLEAVRWNSEQESKIRNLLSSLNLSVLPDLNARLNQQNNNYLDFVEENMKAMISSLSNENSAEPKQPNIREAVGKFIIDNLQGDASSGIADMCRRIVLEEFKANIAINVSSNPANEEHTYLDLLWPFNLIKRCDWTTIEAAVKILCEEVKLADQIMQQQQASTALRLRKTMLPILLWFLNALGNGKIIVERKLRVGFLTTWLPVMAQLIHPHLVNIWFSNNMVTSKFQQEGSKIKFSDVLKTKLCSGVINVVETLPFADWKGIYKIWIDCCDRNYIDLSIPFAWGCKLLQEPQD